MDDDLLEKLKYKSDKVDYSVGACCCIGPEIGETRCPCAIRRDLDALILKTTVVQGGTDHA